jgi:hypothetical protein
MLFMGYSYGAHILPDRDGHFEWLVWQTFCTKWQMGLCDRQFHFKVLNPDGQIGRGLKPLTTDEH